jgi:iron uptake system component EfeO
MAMPLPRQRLLDLAGAGAHGLVAAGAAVCGSANTSTDVRLDRLAGAGAGAVPAPRPRDRMQNLMRGARVLAVAGLVALVVTACSRHNQAAPVHEATVQATDTACTLGETELTAGVITFSITNAGSKTTEFEVLQSERTLGEIENISPHSTRNMSVELTAGTYQGVCKPGMAGEGIKAAFSVSGTATSLTTDKNLAFAVTNYREYVRSQAALLVRKTKEFTNAVRAGDIAGAKSLYPVAHSYYETIEPVAASFGDLDPAIDARDGDLDPGVQWTGFHVLEQHLWVTGDISKDKALADRLDADVQKLADFTRTIDLKPLEIADGAKELLDEVTTRKITGEEDRYSHIDLSDFASNVDGVKAVLDALRPALTARDSVLMADVDAKYAVVTGLLDKQKVGGGYKLYTALTPAEIKGLADAINELAEPASKIAATIQAVLVVPSPGN